MIASLNEFHVNGLGAEIVGCTKFLKINIRALKKYVCLSYDVASESVITSCITNDSPLVH